MGPGIMERSVKCPKSHQDLGHHELTVKVEYFQPKCFNRGGAFPSYVEHIDFGSVAMPTSIQDCRIELVQDRGD